MQHSAVKQQLCTFFVETLAWGRYVRRNSRYGERAKQPGSTTDMLINLILVIAHYIFIKMKTQFVSIKVFTKTKFLSDSKQTLKIYYKSNGNSFSAEANRDLWRKEHDYLNLVNLEEEKTLADLKRLDYFFILFWSF